MAPSKRLLAVISLTASLLVAPRSYAFDAEAHNNLTLQEPSAVRAAVIVPSTTTTFDRST